MSADAATRELPRWVRLGAPVFALALRALGATWRIQVTGSNPLDGFQSTETTNKAPLGIAWHHGALVLTHFFRDRDVVVGISRSRDGDSIAAVLGHLGYEAPVRGSTSSGGAKSLRQLIERSNEECPIALLVDGPRGPARRAKLGAATLAQSTGKALTPIGCDARPAIRFRSWDRTLLPLPFARVSVHFGEPLRPTDASPEGETAELAELNQSLEAAQSNATRNVS